MKKTICFSVITLFLITGCAGGSKQSAEELVVINVTKSYPKKELKLQDIFDIEYIPLETTDEFLCGNRFIRFGDNFIAVSNRDQSIIIFDRNGKGLRKINNRGQGPGEYLVVGDIAFDGDNNEMFVLDVVGNRMFVYDLNGKFIRSFKFQDGYATIKIINFDRDHLMCITLSGKPRCYILSKQDGAIKESIEVPFEKQITMMEKDDLIGRLSEIRSFTYIPYRNNLILSDFSSDTFFIYSPDFKMTPFLARTPSIHSMNTKLIFLPSMFTDFYYFMEIENYTTHAVREIVYDCRERAVFECALYNEDYPDEPFSIRPGGQLRFSYNKMTAYFAVFDSFRLVEANQAGKLKGRLKEIASQLDEEDNPVLMLLKHKN